MSNSFTARSAGGQGFGRTGRCHCCARCSSRRFGQGSGPTIRRRKLPATQSTTERYLTLDELQALLAAPGRLPNQSSADAIRLLNVTGARRGEVLNATWDQFDLTAGLWVKPAATTKQKKLHRVPLNATARGLLGRMKAEATGPLLFPGRRVGAAQTNVKRTWAGVCKRAAIQGVRVHDLRHSYASYLASSGMSLPVIGALLGHSSPATTNRYAHLLDQPLRDATERIDAIVDGAGGPT